PGPFRIDAQESWFAAQPPRRAAVPRIALSHYPDVIRLARSLQPDLYLAGHTHGGQICLPNETAIFTHDSLPRQMCKGAHDVDGTCTIVSRGMGFSGLPVRAFCPAEVIEVEMKGET